MRGRSTSRVALLFATLAIGACLVLPLCSSVLAAAAGDSKSLRGKDGSEVAVGVTRSGPDAKSPEGTSDDSSQSGSASGRKKSVARWRSSSTGVLRRFGKGPKFLLSMSAIIGTAFLLSRAGNVLLRCLADTGGRGNSASEGPESEACERLREWSENGQNVESTRLAKLLPSGSLSANFSRKMVTTVALLSLIAVALANPVRKAKNHPELQAMVPGTEDHSERGESLVSTRTSDDSILESIFTGNAKADAYGEDDDDLGEDYDDSWSGSEDIDWDELRALIEKGELTVQKAARESMPPEDPTYPSLTVTDKEVTIGDTWRDMDGNSKTGSEQAVIKFEYEGKAFTVRLSQRTEQALDSHLLTKLKSVLSHPPPLKEGEVLIWGESDDTVRSIVDDQDKVAPFELYLPKNAFGIESDSDLPRENQYQGWVDVWIAASHILYAAKTGGAPPTPVPPPTVPPVTAAAAGGIGAAYEAAEYLMQTLADVFRGLF